MRSVRDSAIRYWSLALGKKAGAAADAVDLGTERLFLLVAGVLEPPEIEYRERRMLHRISSRPKPMVVEPPAMHDDIAGTEAIFLEPTWVG